MAETQLSVTEWTVLGLLGEGPSHAFALARNLRPDGDLGRILTVRQPLVYRAVDRLVASGLAAPSRVEPGDSGPRRTVYEITPAGRRRLRRWLGAPVGHVRDMRLEFLLKLALTERERLPVLPLIVGQEEAIAETLHALRVQADPQDDVDLWRLHNAAAVASFLAALAARHRAAPP